MDDTINLDPAEKRHVRIWLALAAAGALVVGLLLGGALNVGSWLFGGTNAQTVATSALESMRAQNRLVPFVARYVAVVSSRQSRLGGLISSERTLVLPGDVRYELDLSKLQQGDVRWDDGSKTLTVTLPEIEIAGPEVDLKAAREYGEGGVLAVISDSTSQLDQANRARAVADLRTQAQGAVPMRLAREAGRQAVERSFALPLEAAGFKGAKVVAKYGTDATQVNGDVLDHSRSYNEVVEEAARNRSGRK